MPGLGSARPLGRWGRRDEAWWGTRGVGMPPVPAGLMPVASKDTGGLPPTYKGLGPKTEVQGSLGPRTYTQQIW